MDIKKNFLELIHDLGEVIVILFLIIVISRLVLGADMLVPLVAVTSQSMLHKNNEDWKNWLIEKGISKEKIEKFPMQNGFDMGDMILVKTPNGKGKFLGIKFPTLFSETKFGDVVIYNRDKEHGGGEPIIHRVVGIVKIKNFSVDSIEGTLDCLSKEDFDEKYIPFIINCINNKKEKCPYNEFPKDKDFNFYITKGDNNRGTDQCGSIAYPVNQEQLSARGWIVLPYIGWLKLILNEFIKLIL